MVGQITGKMFDHPIEIDSVSDLSDPGSCWTGKCCNLEFSCSEGLLIRLHPVDSTVVVIVLNFLVHST